MVSHLIERMAAHLSWWASNDFPAQRLPQPVHRIPPFHILKSSLSVLKQKGKEMKCVASMKRSTFTSTFHQDWCSQPIASSPTYFDSREEQLKQIRTLTGGEIYRLFKGEKKKKLSWKVLVAMLQNVGQLISCYHFTTCFYPREQNTWNKTVQKSTSQ